MAINDPAATKWSNEKIRRLADRLLRSYTDAKGVLTHWGVGVSDMFPDNAAEVVEDGAHSTADPKPDGRLEINGADVNTMITCLSTLVTAYEAMSDEVKATVVKVSVNG